MPALRVQQLLLELLPVGVCAGFLDDDLFVVVGELVDDVFELFGEFELVELGYAVGRDGDAGGRLVLGKGAWRGRI